MALRMSEAEARRLGILKDDDSEQDARIAEREAEITRQQEAAKKRLPPGISPRYRYTVPSTPTRVELGPEDYAPPIKNRPLRPPRFPTAAFKYFVAAAIGFMIGITMGLMAH